MLSVLLTNAYKVSHLPLSYRHIIHVQTRIGIVGHVWQCMVCTWEESWNECEILFALASESLPALISFGRSHQVTFRKYQKQELWFSFSNLLLDSIWCMMLGHKRLEAPVALLREEKEGNSMLKTGKENLVIRGVTSLACVWDSRKSLTEKSIFIMAFLARTELMWNGLSFQWHCSNHPPVFLMYFTIIL